MGPNQNCILSVVSEQTGVFLFTQQPFQNWLIITSSFMTSSFEVVHCFFKRKFQSGSKPLNMIHLFHQLFKNTGLLSIMGCCTHVSLQLQFHILRRPYHSTQLDQYRGWIEFLRHNNTRWTSNFLHLSYWIRELRAYRDNDWALAFIIAMSSVVTTFNMFRHSWEPVYWLGLWWSFNQGNALEYTLGGQLSPAIHHTYNSRQTWTELRDDWIKNKVIKILRSDNISSSKQENEESQL